MIRTIFRLRSGQTNDGLRIGLVASPVWGNLSTIVSFSVNCEVCPQDIQDAVGSPLKFDEYKDQIKNAPLLISSIGLEDFCPVGCIHCNAPHFRKGSIGLDDLEELADKSIICFPIKVGYHSKNKETTIEALERIMDKAGKKEGRITIAKDFISCQGRAVDIFKADSEIKLRERESFSFEGIDVSAIALAMAAAESKFVLYQDFNISPYCSCVGRQLFTFGNVKKDNILEIRQNIKDFFEEALSLAKSIGIVDWDAIVAIVERRRREVRRLSYDEIKTESGNIKKIQELRNSLRPIQENFVSSPMLIGFRIKDSGLRRKEKGLRIQNIGLSIKHPELNRGLRQNKKKCSSALNVQEAEDENSKIEVVMEQVLKEFKENGIVIRKGGKIKGRKKLSDETIKQIRREIEVWMGKRPLSELGWSRWRWKYCLDETKEAFIEMLWRRAKRKSREKLKTSDFKEKLFLGKTLYGLLYYHQDYLNKNRDKLKLKQKVRDKDVLRDIIDNWFDTPTPHKEEIEQVLINSSKRFELNDAKGFAYRWPLNTAKVLANLVKDAQSPKQIASNIVLIDYSLTHNFSLSKKEFTSILKKYLNDETLYVRLASFDSLEKRKLIPKQKLSQIPLPLLDFTHLLELAKKGRLSSNEETIFFFNLSRQNEEKRKELENEFIARYLRRQKYSLPTQREPLFEAMKFFDWRMGISFSGVFRMKERRARQEYWQSQDLLSKRQRKKVNILGQELQKGADDDEIVKKMGISLEELNKIKQ
ncbi:MAG: hypothetical protein KJ569_05770, partial [Candidatus Omnitrophica bacterium]|nr:hypothetical protein [Candidatus Omnitrophota bacterium]